MVTIALRPDVVGFAFAVNRIELLPILPDPGVIVNHG